MKILNMSRYNSLGTFLFVKKEAFYFFFLIVFFLPIMPSSYAEETVPRLMPHCQKVLFEAQLAIGEKEYEKAKAILERFIKGRRGKHHFLFSFTLGNIYAETGKPEAALHQYMLAIKKYPFYEPSWQNMGRIYYDLKQYEKAGNAMLKAWEFGGKADLLPLYHASIFYMMANHADRAFPLLETLISGTFGEVKNEWMEAYIKACVDLSLQKQGISAIRKMLEKNNHNNWLWKALARLYLGKGDHRNALASYKIFLYAQKEPIQKDYLFMGALYHALNVPLEAARCYETALSYQKDADLYEKVASAYIAACRFDRAGAVLKDALLEFKTPRLYYLSGQIRYQEKKYEDAYSLFHEASCLDGTFGYAFFMKGHAAFLNGQLDIAYDAFLLAEKFPDLKKQAKEMCDYIEKNKRLNMILEEKKEV